MIARRRGDRARFRDHRSSIVVTALSSAFGVTLLSATHVLAVYVAGSQVGGHGSVQGALTIVATVFIVIAIYVGAIVVTNTFAVIVAGRTRTIALMRLLGSTAGAQRRSVSREGLAVGLIGALIGTVAGFALTAIGVQLLIAVGDLPSRDYTVFQPAACVPALIVVATTWLSSWLGSRRVLSVTPLQALGSSTELSNDEARRRPARNAIAIVLFSLGIGFIALGVAVGLVSQAGLLISVLGGIFSFTGLVLGAHLIMPPVLRLTGRMLGRSAPATIAAENATRYPERSSRTTIGLVIGITLITMFAVASASFQTMVTDAQKGDPQLYQGVSQALTVVVSIFSALVGFSAVIAAIGMINNLSLGILQRTRELGLLRALGFSSLQVRRMVLAESAQLTIASVITGVVLGVFYGWAGAQSLLGSLPKGGGLVVPTIPLTVLAITILAAAALTAIASIAPTRRAVSVSPIVALAVD
jgi:putative ABC transport system permease protein